MVAPVSALVIVMRPDRSGVGAGRLVGRALAVDMTVVDAGPLLTVPPPSTATGLGVPGVDGSDEPGVPGDVEGAPDEAAVHPITRTARQSAIASVSRMFADLDIDGFSRGNGPIHACTHRSVAWAECGWKLFTHGGR
jgi:hypothetical protein